MKPKKCRRDPKHRTLFCEHHDWWCFECNQLDDRPNEECPTCEMLAEMDTYKEGSSF